MASAPDLAVRLYGTKEEVPPPRVLQAGRLSVELEAGNLRYIRFDGIELIRAVSFIVRDRNWGTYGPEIENLTVDDTVDGFRITYDATVGESGQSFHYHTIIEGTGERLVFQAEGKPTTDFVTNRAGFVVLHPIAGVAGAPVEMEKVNGSTVTGRFPRLIDPFQPMMDLRCLTHEAAPGLRVACRMEGEAYEMEDQRNWTDASYKTYVRPLAKPWPYTLKAGDHLKQSVSISIAGEAEAQPSDDGPVILSLGEPIGTAPSLGVGLDPDEIQATRAAATTLTRAGARHVICHYDSRRGHDRKTLENMATVASALGAEPWLEAVVTTIDDVEQEVEALGAAVSAIGAPFKVVLLSPAPDLKCTLPGSTWPPAPDPVAMFRTARKAFPGVRIGGGMFSFFTELNRKRPPTEELDLVSFTTAAQVHAGDDRSVMEGLEALPAIAASAHAIAGTLPFAVGPSAMGLRMNPYGDAPMANPRNIRQAMNFNDPRQRGLLGAAWTLGYYSRFAAGGAAAIAIGDTTGPTGLLHAPHGWPAPWYAEHGGVFPVFHVIRGLASQTGRSMRALQISDSTRVQGIAFDAPGGCELWVANLTPSALEVALPTPATELFLLDAERFVEAANTLDFAERLTAPKASENVTLDAFALARIRLS